MISESMLRDAALQSGKAYVQFFESTCDTEKPHVFSAQFEQKIEKLNRKANFTALRTFVRYTAAILLVMLISGSAWLMLDVKARAESVGWIKGIYNSSYFSYRYETAEPPNEPTVRYELPSIPDGYTLFYEKEDNGMVAKVYKDSEERFLKFMYAHNADEQFWLFDMTYSELTPTKVNGIDADLLLSHNENTANSVLWVLPDNTAFFLSAFLDEEDLIRLAESVEAIPIQK